ncbi:tyrosine-type recombinase/integrase [Cognatiyoonia sp.]|uniref:tyrosine-type recombinase/integrase n=1 Tax=Cognatiyoonia sp. TaxID=2211652 RepID=UPI003F69DA1C
MKQNIPYLTKSPKTGRYGYRRWLSSELKPFFPKNGNEYKVSFKTKDFNEAFVKLTALNKWFDTLEAMADGTADYQTGGEKLTAAKAIVEQVFLDPALEEANLKEWEDNDAKLLNREWAQDILEDKGLMVKSHDGWVTNRNVNEADPLELAAVMTLQGKEDWDFTTTLQDVLNNYLQGNLEKSRSTQQDAKVKRAVPRLFERFAAHLQYGLRTDMEKLERYQVKDICAELWPNPSTRKRNLALFTAAINAWNLEYPKKPLANIFAGLVTGDAASQAAKERRPFTPEEERLYRNALLQSDDKELSILGHLMLYCGCPNGEALSLALQDIKLHDDVPYLRIKPAFKGKDRLARAVPLVGEFLTTLTEYSATLENEGTMLFPRLSRMDSADVSKRLSRCITNLRSNDPRLLSPYSARHTFMDRYRAAGVPSEIGKYLAGHKDKDSNRVHDSYGTNRPPSQLVQHMKAITDVCKWGHFE